MLYFHTDPLKYRSISLKTICIIFSGIVQKFCSSIWRSLMFWGFFQHGFGSLTEHNPKDINHVWAAVRESMESVDGEHSADIFNPPNFVFQHRQEPKLWIVSGGQGVHAANRLTCPLWLFDALQCSRLLNIQMNVMNSESQCLYANCKMIYDWWSSTIFTWTGAEKSCTFSTVQ